MLHTESQTPPQDTTCDGPALPSAILDSLDIAVLIASRDGVVRYRNANATSILPAGNDLNSILAAHTILGSFDGWKSVIARIIETNAPVHFRCALDVAGSSSPRLANVRCTPLHEDGSPSPTGVVILVETSTDPASADDGREVSQRLASIGKLAARVAHELNNPLDGILRYVNLAMRVAGDASDSKLQSYLSESRTGLMRMVQIIGDLLEFSRATEGEFQDTDINEIVDQAVRNASSPADANGVVVAVDFQAKDMPSVHGSRLYQVCTNLFKNAIEAMPTGGRLTITAGIVDHTVVIRVEDTGAGLPTPADKVFEPFFTTKEPGKGSGLGLAICKDFIEDMQGTITVAPGDNGGAVFTVRIPVAACHTQSPFADSGVESLTNCLKASHPIHRSKGKR